MNHFQQAGQSFEQAQPSTENQTQQQAAPESASLAPQGTDTPKDVTDLGKLEKFLFEGKEWTADQLKKSIMLHSDYTKKTQKVSEVSKYYDNLEYDLENVKSNPALADKFLELYPKQFHKYLKLVVGEERQRQESQNQSSQSSVDPQLEQRLSRFENYVKSQESRIYEEQVSNIFGKMSQKYPEAIEENVLAKAQAFLESNNAKDLTESVWDKLWKQSHDAMIARDQARQKTVLEKQQAANQSFKGPAGGSGQAPSQPAPKMKLKDVADSIIKSMG